MGFRFEEWEADQAEVYNILMAHPGFHPLVHVHGLLGVIEIGYIESAGAKPTYKLIKLHVQEKWTTVSSCLKDCRMCFPFFIFIFKRDLASRGFSIRSLILVWTPRLSLIDVYR
jgi:hypothetical protein